MLIKSEIFSKSADDIMENIKEDCGSVMSLECEK